MEFTEWFGIGPLRISAPEIFRRQDPLASGALQFCGRTSDPIQLAYGISSGFSSSEPRDNSID